MYKIRRITNQIKNWNESFIKSENCYSLNFSDLNIISSEWPDIIEIIDESKNEKMIFELYSSNIFRANYFYKN
jgi:hypothetical protein